MRDTNKSSVVVYNSTMESLYRLQEIMRRVEKIQKSPSLSEVIDELVREALSDPQSPYFDERCLGEGCEQ